MKRRLLNLLIALDQLTYVPLTLGHGSPDETMSAAAYRLWLRDKWLERVAWALTVVAAIGLSRGLSLKAVLS